MTTELKYTYDAFGLPVKLTYTDVDGNTRTVREETSLTYDKNGNILTENTTEAYSGSVTKTKQYAYDLGNRLISATTGGTTTTYGYDLVGNATASSSAFHNDVTFTGSISDASGLLYMNARYYNPQTARFLSQDSYRGVASSPWTQHLYSYCNNNPVNMIDPTGHKALPCLKDFWEWLTGGGNCGGKEEPTPEPSSTPKPITIEVTVAPSTPGPTPKRLPDESLKNLSKELLKEVIVGRAKESGASAWALDWISEASDLLGKPYPPVINGKIKETSGMYHCAKVIREVLKTNIKIDVGGSCLKQKEYFLSHEETWIYETNNFSIEDLDPGDFIYWIKEGGRHPTHVGLYCGNGYMIDSTSSGGGVSYRPVSAFQETPENAVFSFYGYARYKGN